MHIDSPLLGTWRLLSYETWDAEGAVTQPCGMTPAGFAIFDTTGHAFIQLARSSAEGSTVDEVAGSFTAYFGSLAINEAGTELVITVEASNAPSYVGSRQVRPFKIDGDRLVLGIPGQYRATLRRA